MMKRMLAFLCVLALLMGMYVVPATAAATGTESDLFQVGYAKVDINPWVYSDTLGMGVDLNSVTENDSSYVSEITVYNPETRNTTTEKIIQIPMAGYANSASRLSDGIQDDNGDNKVGLGDGLFITCTTVTDANGYTLFMFTSDTVSGYSNFQKDLAAALTAKLDEPVNEDQVTLTGSHTHGGPDLNVLRTATSGKDGTQNAMWKAYYDYVVESVADAAADACKKAQPATMSKGSIDASEVMFANGQVDENGKGIKLNKIRQYWTTQYNSKGEKTGVEFVSGAHLNTYTGAGKAVKGYTYTKEAIADADDTMHILQFTFADELDLDPIILVNWRAHSTITSGNKNHGLTSDYINSFRAAMEENNYRFAFIQGAAGNIVAAGVSADTDVDVDDASKFEIKRQAAVEYGGKLATVALACLSGDNMKNQTGNVIYANHVKMQTEAPDYSDGMIAAATAYKEAYEADELGQSYHPWKHKYYEDNGKYEDSKGKYNYYYINYYRHAEAILNDAAANTLSLSTYKLGNGVAIVTSPNEMYDRYSADVTSLTDARDANRDNDWSDLEGIVGEGMPFVFGYTDGHSGYLGDTLSYTYNTDFDYSIAEKAGLAEGTIDGTHGVGLGSYETNVSRYKQGTGEKVIAKYGEMLSRMSDTCEKCGAVTSRTALTQANIGSLTTLATGHYYLDEHVNIESLLYVEGEVCLDLNGYTLKSSNRVFYCNADTEFSIMDSSENQSGKVISTRNNPTTLRAGGVVYTDTKANITFNLYGGTLQLGTDEDPADTTYAVEKGGVVCLYGTMNMLGGTIKGGKLAEGMSSTSVEAGFGAAIYAFSGSTLNVSGGTIESGEVPESSKRVYADGSTRMEYTPKGDCVYLAGSAGRVILSGNANVEEIYINNMDGENITIGKAATNDSEAKAFTGTAKLAVNTANITVTDAGVDIGTVACGEIPSGLTCTDDNCRVEAKGSNLYICQGNGVVRIGNEFYQDLGTAIGEYNSANGSYIQLLKDLDTVNLPAGKTVYLDLNGYNIGNVNGSGKLYCMDSETDDYQVDAVNHTGYGKITGTIASGVTVEGVPVDAACAEDGYLMVAEKNGAYQMATVTDVGQLLSDGYNISFHRVNLQLTSIILSDDGEETEDINPSVKYESAFAADAVVAGLINANQDNTFGVALSVKSEKPTDDNWETDWQHSTFADTFAAGKAGNKARSTLLRGVMKETNPKLINQRNAGLQVYGCAYIQIGGKYMFGGVDSRNLREVMEGKETDLATYPGTDDIWNTLGEADQKFIVEVYTTYRSIMEKWDKLENIRAAYQEDYENKTLKVLAIGNSFSNDTTTYLYDVALSEGYTDLVVKRLYIGGCTLAMHLENANTNAAAYTYYYYDSDSGKWTSEKNKATLRHALEDDYWDIITMQQGSSYSGEADTYTESIGDLVAYVNKYKSNPDAKLVWHMTWAYQEGCAQKAFEKYDKDQMTMYNAIVGAVTTVISPMVENGVFDKIIPVGTAIQNVRTSFIGDTLNKNDGYHLNPLGDLIGAYTWYSVLTGKTVESIKLNKVDTIELTPNHKTAILEAINAAIATPFDVTQSAVTGN